MFKGLKAKIEGQEQGQIDSAIDSRASNKFNTSQNHGSSNNATSSRPVDRRLDSTSNEKPLPSSSSTQPIIAETHPTNDASASHKLDQISRSTQLLQNIEELHSEVARLNDQLKAVIKEKDESNDQNTQLYQLIEKLRRNLETEKEVNSSLQNKLVETGNALKEKSDLIDGPKNRTSGSISMKSFDTINLASGESVEVLNQRINILQNQLLEKNRLLKIRQQNITDIKKTLQKELIEHGKTQEELNKLRDQIKTGDKINNDSHEGSALQNGSVSNYTDAVGNLSSVLDDRQQGSSQSLSHVREESKSSTTAQQSDNISILSRSTASVDDCEPYDLAQNSSNKVNLEYLRNVLYRYMTTSDTETAQHLVKALSVLMDFTPEQSAAVKSAMYNRSSWLRLK